MMTRNEVRWEKTCSDGRTHQQVRPVSDSYIATITIGIMVLASGFLLRRCKTPCDRSGYICSPEAVRL